MHAFCFRLLVATFALLLTAGCAPPRLKFVHHLPGEIAVPRATQLSLVQITGLDDDVASFYRDLQAEVAAGGYFTLQDRTYDGLSLDTDGESATLRQDAEEVELPENEAGLRVDLLGLDVREGLVDRGALFGRQDGVIGSINLVVTMVQHDGTPIMITVPFYASCGDSYEQETVRSDSSLRSCASRDAARELVRRITPIPFRQSISLEGSGKALEPIFEAVKKDDLRTAMLLAEAYRQENPEDPVAIFNVAVLLDALGSYESALTRYDEAIARVPRTHPRYRTARFGCQQRMAAQKAMTEGAPAVIGAL